MMTAGWVQERDSSKREWVQKRERGLKYHYVAVTASSKSDPEFLKLNPLALIPVLVDGDFVLVESLAIIMYLDDNYPQYPSLPHDIPKRALNFQVAHIVLQNNVIEKNVGPHEKLPWAQSVIRKGFTALEKLLKDHAGRYATGDEIFLRRKRELADELRAQVVEELMKRCEETKWFIEGDFDTYLKRIQQPYVWGGEPVLLMASHVLKTPISVLMRDTSSLSLVNIAKYGEEYRNEKDMCINVLFHGYGHYDIGNFINREFPGIK
ncbi:Glutathione S-transferase [Arachis hypogaea]|nr:Glutathione S-transferase [Arachis hypogaea]